MITDSRLKELIDYARALHVMAVHGRGNVKDTADIVKALQELQAYHAMWASIQNAQRRVA